MGMRKQSHTLSCIDMSYVKNIYNEITHSFISLQNKILKYSFCHRLYIYIQVQKLLKGTCN